MQVYTKPSYDSPKLNKVLDRQHEQWKHEHANELNLSLQEMNNTLKYLYTRRH